jgi:Uma2 family endonuclease
MNAVQIPIDEYLETAWSPDREFVDGVVVERHVGERPHSRMQTDLSFSLKAQAPNRFVWVEQRIRTKPDRRRVPDICVTLNDPGTDVFETPPLICIEILSRRDEASEVLEKLAEYRAAGVAYVWLIDPRRRKAYLYDGALREIESLIAPEADIDLALDRVFEGV